MPGNVRSWLLGAILAVLLGGVVVAMVRGDTAMAQLFVGPLGIITGALVWAEQHDKEKAAKEKEKSAEAAETTRSLPDADGGKRAPSAPGGDGDVS